MQQRDPQRKKTLAPRFASPLLVPTKYGVITAMICLRQYKSSTISGKSSTYAVPEPIGRGRDTNTARSDWKGEDLSNNHPRTRAPGRSEERDVEADEGNHSRDSSMIML